MPRLVLIDGHAIIHRAYHAYPPLTTSKGELVGAVYGFTSILLTVLQKLHPEYVAVAFDKKAPTFRHKKFKDYKAHRKPVDEELIGQIPRVHQVVGTLNIPIFELDGFEADDVIGTLARQADKEVIIVTGDADALQLVNDQVKVYMPARGKQPEKIYDRVAVLEKYKLEPKQIVGLKTLSGDASDNIPGVSGVGPKTAASLLKKYNTVEEIYKHLDELPVVLREKLKKDKKNALLSQMLATIDTNVPIKLKISRCRLIDYNKEKVVKLFGELEFKSLIKKLPSDGQPAYGSESSSPIDRTSASDPSAFGSTKSAGKEKKEDNNQLGLF